MNKKNIRFIVLLIIIITIICGIYYNKLNQSYKDQLYRKINIDKSSLNIFYLNVGQGDSTLIINGDYTMLIDAGNPADGYYITEFLKTQGIKRIDYLIGTHIDDDHIGGMYKIIEQMDIGNVYVPNNQYSKNSYDSMKRELERKNKAISTINENEEYMLGSASCKVLSVDNSSPSLDNDEAINDTSIVLEVDYKETKYLFMGDASSNIEKALLEEVGKVDVLKVAHHGSNKSTSREFLEKINPTYSIISVGKNGYGHPSNKVLERLEEIKTKLYITQSNGTIWIKSNGENIEIEELEYNLDGANRKISCIESLNMLYCFTKAPSLLTT